MKTDKADKSLTTLQQRQADNQTAQDKLKAEVAEIARNAPAARSAAQNDRLQAAELERQELVNEAAVITADLAAASKA